MFHRLCSLSDSRRAQGLVEYALLIAFVALVVIVVLVIFGPALGGVYNNIINQI